MIGTKEWKKQKGDTTPPVKSRNSDSKLIHNSCGGCNACHQMTRVHSVTGSPTWDGSGDRSQRPCATNFFQRHLGNNYMQSVAGGQSSLGGAPTIQRKCACGGSCASCAGQEGEEIRVQPKLTIGPVNDVYEREADRVAEQVMRMPYSPGLDDVATARQSPDISRYVGQRATRPIARQSEEEEKITEADLLSMKKVPGASSKMSDGLATQIQSLRGGGQPLAPELRAFFEPRFGYDFSHVRIHTSAHAAKTARALNARAYTLGHDVAFAPGEYQSETPRGQKLLAHELTHVVQQSNQVQTVMRVCDCPAIGARNPTASEESKLSGYFPRLVSGDWCVSAPATPTYNCIAWSIGDTSAWIWDEVDSVYGDNDGTVSISDFDSFYAMGGMAPVTDSTPADPKVILYSKGSTPTHAAQKSPHPCGFAFESKLGKYVRIIHDAYQLEGGSVYGDVNRFYV